MRRTASRVAHERGASAAEYGLLISLIAIVVIAGVSAFGLRLEALHNQNCDDVAAAISGATCPP